MASSSHDRSATTLLDLALVDQGHVVVVTTRHKALRSRPEIHTSQTRCEKRKIETREPTHARARTGRKDSHVGSQSSSNGDSLHHS